MDKQFTENIRDWLALPPQERDPVAGATMLLQLNRNQIFFRNVMRRPEKFADKLEYELKKHLRIRDRGHTLQDVVAMEERLMPAVATTLETDEPQAAKTAEEDDTVEVELVRKGRSPHHHLFPERIKAVYDRGGALYEQMRKLYNMLLGMMDAAPCDRHELLVQLDKAHREYRDGWTVYDEFAGKFDPEHPEPETEEPREPGTPDASAPDAKAVSAARKYLSEKRTTIARLEVGSQAHSELLASMQERVDTIVASGGTFKPDFGESLRKLGLDLTE